MLSFQNYLVPQYHDMFSVDRLNLSLFRKGLPCSVIILMILAAFIKSRLPYGFVMNRAFHSGLMH